MESLAAPQAKAATPQTPLPQPEIKHNEVQLRNRGLIVSPESHIRAE